MYPWMVYSLVPSRKAADAGPGKTTHLLRGQRSAYTPGDSLQTRVLGRTMNLIDSVLKRCADVAPSLVEDHFRRLPENYFERYSVAQISRHVRLVSRLGKNSLVQVEIQSLGTQVYEVLVVGFDQVGVLAGITTMLMSEGFNVQDVLVSNYFEEDGRPTYFIDTFRVTTKQTIATINDTVERFRERLQTTFNKLLDGKFDPAELSTARKPAMSDPHQQTVLRRDALEGVELDDRFRIHSKLASGGMSTVYLGDEMPSGRRIAVKVLRHRDDLIGEEMQARFIREARVLASFQCTSIVQILGSGVFVDPHNHNRHWMALEYLTGGDLANWVKTHGPPPLAVGLRWFRQSLEGLAYAHQRGVLHRDLKPHNLLLNAEGDVQLTDFGLLKQVDQPGMGHTLHGTILGTPQFMAPEQALGEAIDERSDIFSLGMTFYKVLSGRLPFDEESATAVLSKVVRQDLPALSSVSPDLSGPVSVIIGRMLARRRDERYQSVSVILQDIASYERRGVLKIATTGRIDPPNDPPKQEPIAQLAPKC